MNNHLFLEAVKKQIKFKAIGDDEVENPIKTYLAQAPFTDKKHNKRN